MPKTKKRITIRVLRGDAYLRYLDAAVEMALSWPQWVSGERNA